MTTDSNTFQANLFYSYSHKDAQYRDNMEKALDLLKRNKLLKDWSDRNILPGQSISQEIKEEMDKADILVFLLSRDFIASNACMEEWEYAKQLSAEGKPIFRIPILLRDCSWEDLLSGDDIKALPNDANPVTSDDEDTAWKQVYEGIKNVINQLRRTFTPKLTFLEEMEKTDFEGQQHIKLQDIFLFPTLSCYSPQGKDRLLQRETIEDQTGLLRKKYILIHGEDMSGKTALGRHLFLSLTDTQSTPVLYIDLEEVPRKFDEKVFSDAYYRQFSGDYSLWKEQKGKILILDNLSSAPTLIELIENAKDFFDKIVITLSSNIFYSFFRDEARLADFHEVKIEPLNHKQQEELIRKRLALSDRNEPIPDGFIDQIEYRINSIIISKKIVPRYPFFVLSILQLYEGFMPDNLSITSHGHCYHALIVATLVKAGIVSEKDKVKTNRDTVDNMNTCFNFAERLAFKIYQDGEHHAPTKSDFNSFVDEYKENYVIEDPILNRLKERDYGIITEEGRFKARYMYYFFLGRFLSKRNKENQVIIEQMCERSHVSSNYLTLLFVIHHTNDDEIIDNILLRTMWTLETIDPAILNQKETDNFKEIVNALPENILSSNSVKHERKKEREIRDINDNLTGIEDDSEEPIDENPVNDIYRILKNNEITGQILRNKYGNLEKVKIKEIIEIMADSGLRLVKLGLVNKNWITDEAHYLHERYPDLNIEEIRRLIQFFSFLWTMANIEKIVCSVNIPEIKRIVDEVVQQKSTPAYDLIGYFNRLDNSESLTERVKQELEILLKKHDDFFFKRVLSIRTQHYMNTHHSKARIEQSVCSLLNIRYFHNPSKSKT